MAAQRRISVPMGSAGGSSSGLASSAGVQPRDTPEHGAARWFFPTDSRAPAPEQRTRGGALAIALFVIALLAVALMRGLFLRALLPIVLAIAAVIVLVRRRRGLVRARPRAVGGRALVLTGGQLVFHQGGGAARVVVSDDTPFGLTLVSTRARDRLVAALTSTAETFYVGAALGAEDRRRHASLLSRAAIVSADEAGIEALGPDGEPLDLPPDELADLVELLGAIDPLATERIILSDARGAPVVLDGSSLRVGEQLLDLASPLEWRGVVFQQPFGLAAAIYQGTWIRQGGAEVVLVSLLPSLVPHGPLSTAEATGIPELDRAAMRDLRLLQATPEDPPPQEQRVAIDRLFMLPLRAAVDRAPRASVQPTRARA